MSPAIEDISKYSNLKKEILTIKIISDFLSAKITDNGNIIDNDIKHYIELLNSYINEMVKKYT